MANNEDSLNTEYFSDFDYLSDLYTMDRWSQEIQNNMPTLWEDAGIYDIRESKNIYNEDTQKTETVYPKQWTDEQKEYLEKNPLEKTRWILENHIFLKSPELKEKSLEHYIPPFWEGLGEKFKYQALDPMKEMADYGYPIVAGAVTRIGVETANTLEKISTILEPFEDPIGREDFTKEEAVNKNFRDKTKKFIESKPKEQNDRNFAKWLESVNRHYEDYAVEQIKKRVEEKEKDPRYRAWQNYAKEKPVKWFNTFKSPEYATDTIFGMIPSLASTAISFTAGSVAGIAGGAIGGPAGAAKAFVGVSTAVNLPLMASMEAVDVYPEAYLYTLDKTGDEELARSQAAWATSQYLTILGITETWGMSKLAKWNMPSAWKKQAGLTFVRKSSDDTIKDPVKSSLIKRLSENKVTNWIRNTDEFNILKASFSEGFQEYIQYQGNLLTQLGYKDETYSELYDPSEASESVIGGALLGAGFTTAGLIANKNSFREAESILNKEYGIETNPELTSEVVDNNELSQPTLDPVGVAPATLTNYVKELLDPIRREGVVVDRQGSKGNIKELLNKHQVYSKGRILEKLVDVIKEGGKDWLDNLDEDVKIDMNDYIKGAVANINQEILKVVDDQNNIANDIINNKINITVKKGEGITGAGIKGRKINITDKKYADLLVKEYQSDIETNLGENATKVSINNYLSKEQNLEISKQIETSITKKAVTGQGLIEREIQKQAEQQAEQGIIQEVEREILKKKGVVPVGKKEKGQQKVKAPSVIGKKVKILKGKYKDIVGKISVYSEKQNLVKIKTDDGRSLGPMKPDQFAILPDAPVKKEETKEVKQEIINPKEKLDHKRGWSEMVVDNTRVSGKNIKGTNLVIFKNTKGSFQERYGIFNSKTREIVSYGRIQSEAIKNSQKALKDKKTKETDDLTLKSIKRMKKALGLDKEGKYKTKISSLVKKANSTLIKLQSEWSKPKDTDIKKVNKLRDDILKIRDKIELIYDKERISKFLKNFPDASFTKDLNLYLKDIASSRFKDQFKSDDLKKYMQIGDMYEKGEKLATKKFIADALKKVMGKHAPDVQSTLVDELIIIQIYLALILKVWLNSYLVKQLNIQLIMSLYIGFLIGY